MDSIITTRQRRAATNGSEADAPWPPLLGRMLEDLSRVIQLEFRLLEAKIATSLIATADRAIAGLVILYAGVIAGGCFLAALILFLHDWMQWWECFAIAGMVAVACGVVALLSVKRSTAWGEANTG
jgi:Putative Actinobacterial Holin-X, holin superfamily III